MPEVPGPDLLVGSVKAASRTEIMASLPPKAFADKLIDRYFQTSDMGSCESTLSVYNSDFVDMLASDDSSTNFHERGKLVSEELYRID